MNPQGTNGTPTNHIFTPRYRNGPPSTPHKKWHNYYTPQSWTPNKNEEELLFSMIDLFWFVWTPKFQSSYYDREGLKLGPFARTCNPSKWEADIWGWLEVRRSAMLHYTVSQRPHWACQQYGHSGGTRGWLGVERFHLWQQDTSHRAKWHRRAVVGHCWCLLFGIYIPCWSGWKVFGNVIRDGDRLVFLNWFSNCAVIWWSL